MSAKDQVILDRALAAARGFEAAGRRSDAARLYRELLSVAPDCAGAAHGLGRVLHADGQAAQAAEALRHSLAVDPGAAGVWSDLGSVERDLGHAGAAVASYTRALWLRPDNLDAIAGLAKFRHGFGTADHAAVIEAALARQPPPPEETRIAAGIALGTIYERLGDHGAAFRHFAQAKRLRRVRQHFSLEDTAAYFAAIKQVFSEHFLAWAQTVPAASDDTPIFIVGMPRSGSTLVEQILASHPEVAAGDELFDFYDTAFNLTRTRTGHPYPAGVLQLCAADRQALAAQYLDRLRLRAPDARRITDKMLFNFHHLGLIRLLLPNAKVVHCVRDPIDTCLSIFKIDFGDGLPFSCDLGEIGGYFRLYGDLMDHWRRLMPDFIHEIRHEALIADQEGTTRQLLDFCRLPWSDRCLQFDRTERPIRTASALQVRRPLSGATVGSWRAYAPWLGPLFDALGSGARPTTPA